VTIVGEVVHPVSYALVAGAEVAPEQLATVVSHPQGLAQCAAWLRANAPGASLMPAASTAEAVIAVLAGNLPQPAGALATPLAARLHGGVVIAEGVVDEAGNVTRFVRIARTAGRAPVDSLAGGPHRTSIAWWGEGDVSPGWLVRCLSEFAFRGVNLTRIESRPRRSQLGHYSFFADLDGAITDPPVAEAIEALRGQAETVRVLGSYPAGPDSASSN
jgi:prephenate dehydratase